MEVESTRRTQAERSEATQAALISTARRLFAERGYSGVGTEEIVRAAGVTRGALYHHFDGKAGLFAAVFEQIEAELSERFATEALAVPDPWRPWSPGSSSSSMSAASRRSARSHSWTRRPSSAGRPGGRSSRATASV